MNKPKILLLSDNFPSNNYSGGIVSQQLCYYLLEENCQVFCAHISIPGIAEQTDEFVKTHIKTIKFKKPKENPENKESYEKAILDISKKINEFIEANEIDVVWCPLQGETILRLLSMIQKKYKTRLRYVVQIWDPIEWPLHELKYSAKDTQRVLSLFDRTISKADFVLTASRQMNEYYKKKYNIPCAPIFSSYRQTNFFPEISKKDANTFTILMAGQAYAKKSITTLIEALNDLDWHYNNKNIVFEYYGYNNLECMQNNKNIIRKDYVPQEELIQREKQADLLYCPYFFDDEEAYKKVSTQSYPSKVITYLPSKTPILVHASCDSPVYKDFKEYKCGFVLNSLHKEDIVDTIKTIINTSQKEITKIANNAQKLFNTYFTREYNKKTFLNALGIKYDYNKPSYRILEVNNLDLAGKRWNGYDLAEYINKKTHHLASQLVTYKSSHNKNVFEIYNDTELQLEGRVLEFEANNLSVHSCLSTSSPALLEKTLYKNADLVHLHLIHNMKLSLVSLVEICNKKPTIITIHDPWTFTGRCVWIYDCKKYLNGCNDCPNLNNLFPLKCDNCHDLWMLKKNVYDKLDVDYVVTTKYMYDLFQESPLTKGKRVHVIPFGIDTNEFYQKVSQDKAKEHYHIPKDHIVIFHRAQFLSKGTEYVIKALEELKTDKKITIITCSEKGRLDPVRHKYNIIDLGDIGSEELVYAYNACDFFLSPSIGESFCMMAVEAMSCAKPVIVFDNTALPSVTFAPKCGVLAKDRDSHDLMKKIKWMIDDEQERLKRGELARNITIKHYSLEVYNKRIEKLYEDVAKRKHKYINYRTLLEQTPKETDSVIALKKQLNILTKRLFPKHSPQYEEMTYNISRKVPKKTHIKYGELETQRLINQYNNSLVKNAKNFDPYKLYGSLPYKILHKSHTFIKLLITDRKRLSSLVSEKLEKRD